MCDIFPGQLIVCFPKSDVAARALLAQIREGEIGHVSYLESIEARLARVDLKPDPTLGLELHLLEVPPGEETWKINYLQFFYKHALLHAIPGHSQDKEFLAVIRRSDSHFTVVPNHVLSLVSSTTTPRPVSAKNLAFGPHHAQYRAAVGLTGPVASTGELLRIVLLDSGVASDSRIRIQSQRNFVDPKNSLQALDDLGHGNAVSTLINDLAPFTEFVVFKVADSTGRTSEWDALAGLAAQSNAHAINLSLQFGLPGRDCPKCGRESTASRSAVFENVIEQLAKRNPRPLVVAAAGNSAKQELAFPARFANVLAIGGITSKNELSSDSNFGDLDQAGDNHLNHFVMPGGEVDPSKSESVLLEPGRSYQGTSFAAAFATGVVANRLLEVGPANYQYDQLLESIRANADSTSLQDYKAEPQKYGHGVMQASS